MNFGRWINTAGLGLTILGAILLFFFGIPVDVDPKGRIMLVAENRDEDEIHKGKLYLGLGRLGLGFIVIGSALQIWATWIGFHGN